MSHNGVQPRRKPGDISRSFSRNHEEHGVEVASMDIQEIEARIEERIEDAEATVERARGEHDDDHLRAVVVSPAFEGIPIVQQHDMVYDALEGVVTREVHALELETRAP